MADKKNVVEETSTKVYKAEDFEKDFTAGESVEINFEPLMNTKVVGSTVAIEFIQDSNRTFTTKNKAVRHEVIVKKYNPETKQWGDKVKCGMHTQLFELVKAGNIIPNERYLIKLVDKKALGGGKTFNVFDVKPLRNK